DLQRVDRGPAGGLLRPVAAHDQFVTGAMDGGVQLHPLEEGQEHANARSVQPVRDETGVDLGAERPEQHHRSRFRDGREREDTFLRRRGVAPPRVIGDRAARGAHAFSERVFPLSQRSRSLGGVGRGHAGWSGSAPPGGIIDRAARVASPSASSGGVPSVVSLPTYKPSTYAVSGASLRSTPWATSRATFRIAPTSAGASLRPP